MIALEMASVLRESVNAEKDLMDWIVVSHHAQISAHLMEFATNLNASVLLSGVVLTARRENAQLTARVLDIVWMELVCALLVGVEMIARSSRALEIAHSMGFVNLMELAHATMDIWAMIAPCSNACETALVKDFATRQPVNVFAIPSLLVHIVKGIHVLMIVPDGVNATKMLANANAILITLERTVQAFDAPMIATTTGSASTGLAIATVDSVDSIVTSECAPISALTMGCAKVVCVFASILGPVQAAARRNASLVVESMATASMENACVLKVTVADLAKPPHA